MTRRWQPGIGWIADATPRPCRTCGAPVPRLPGMGRPRLYCAIHAPARRESVAAWQRANAAHLREYGQRRNGHRPTRDVVCSRCAAPYRSWLAADLCARCRRHPAGEGGRSLTGNEPPARYPTPLSAGDIPDD